jgi:hypothetical protein
MNIVNVAKKVFAGCAVSAIALFAPSAQSFNFPGLMAVPSTPADQGCWIWEGTFVLNGMPPLGAGTGVQNQCFQGTTMTRKALVPLIHHTYGNHWVHVIAGGRGDMNHAWVSCQAVAVAAVNGQPLIWNSGRATTSGPTSGLQVLDLGNVFAGGIGDGASIYVDCDATFSGAIDSVQMPE